LRTKCGFFAVFSLLICKLFMNEIINSFFVSKISMMDLFSFCGLPSVFWSFLHIHILIQLHTQFIYKYILLYILIYLLIIKLKPKLQIPC